MSSVIKSENSTSNAFASLMSHNNDGFNRPFSNREIVASADWNLSANSNCVIPLEIRNSRTLKPNWMSVGFCVI